MKLYYKNVSKSFFIYNVCMKLQIGDKIGIIAPSGVVFDKEGFHQKVQVLIQLGFKVEVFPSVLKSFDFLSASDNERLEDLHNAFLNPEIKAILCARGGYGALRLVDKIDYDLIKNNPKIFIGFSDITILHVAFYKHANLKTFHAPMLLSGFADCAQKDCLDTINGFKKEILGKKALIEGEAQGILWGGNLSSLVCCLCGDEFIPNEDIILFLEDVCEPLYKLDKMMTQILRHKTLMSKIKGVVFGDFILNDKKEKQRLNFWLDIWAKEFNVPCSLGFKISHGKNNEAIPFGVYSKLIGTKICLL